MLTSKSLIAAAYVATAAGEFHWSQRRAGCSKIVRRSARLDPLNIRTPAASFKTLKFLRYYGSEKDFIVAALPIA
jgi:hypothetical protein